MNILCLEFLSVISDFSPVLVPTYCLRSKRIKPVEAFSVLRVPADLIRLLWLNKSLVQ